MNRKYVKLVKSLNKDEENTFYNINKDFIHNHKDSNNSKQ